MNRILPLCLALCAALPALAQSDDGLAPPSSERVLAGKVVWEHGSSWLVTDQGRYRLPFSWRPNQAQLDMTSGWLKGRRVEVRGRVSPERDGGQRLRVLELIDPAPPAPLRARVEAGPAGALTVVADGRRLQVLETPTTRALLPQLVGKTVVLRAYVFRADQVLVLAVRAWARDWHFNPIVSLAPLFIPRWCRPGTAYWIYTLEGEQVSIGSVHLARERLSFEPPAAKDSAPAQAPAPGLTDQLPAR